MNYLSAENISKNYGDKILFQDQTFGISQGQKVALVGVNGSGKSSLLRVLAMVDQPDEGSVSLRKGIRMEFLIQEPEFDDQLTVFETLFQSDHPGLAAVREYESLLNNPDADSDKLQAAITKMDEYKAWDFEARIKEILGRLGIQATEQPISELSGGQRKRVALARVLINEPQFLVLDEPTNHLDLDTIEWLEGYLATSKMTLLMVTHDRYFLDRITDEILELDNGQLYRYKGNYAYFLEKKAEREAQADAEIAKAQNLMRKELDWMRRSPKARTTKSKARIDAFYELQGKARNRRPEAKIDLQVKSARMGSKILEMYNVSKAYGDLKLLDKFSYVFKRKERIGIVGPNGAGKTTFLNMITGKEPLDSGEIRTGETIVFGYFTQSGLVFKPGQRVIDVVKEAAEVIKTEQGSRVGAAQFLTHFNFPYKTQNTHVSKISGGEKRRLHLLRVLIQNPNFLILDEPTNDLDLLTLNVLEEFLLKFEGCLVIVSHDRYFMDKLVDHVFVFRGDGQIKDYPGNYSQYREWQDEQDKEAKKAEVAKLEKAAPTRTREKEKKKLSYKEKREFEALESEIEELEARKTELTELLNSGSTDYTALTEWGEELEQVKESLDEKEMRWLELSEFAD